MGFRYESSSRRQKNAPRPASGIGMILIFIVLAFSIWLGWWLPLNVPLLDYLPISRNWYNPFVPNVSIRPIQVAVGVVAFILLQFLVVLIQGVIAPPPPKDKYDEDGMYKRD
jgi:hypothetical protein